MGIIAFTTEEKALLKNLDVEAVVLFGSRAQKTAGPLSDFDFGILMSKPGLLKSSGRRRAVYDEIYILLSQKINKLVDIDIVFLDDAPLELQSHAAKYGMAFYERMPHSFFRFRERVFDLYADFAPLREIFHESILLKIP